MDCDRLKDQFQRVVEAVRSCDQPLSSWSKNSGNDRISFTNQLRLVSDNFHNLTGFPIIIAISKTHIEMWLLLIIPILPLWSWRIASISITMRRANQFRPAGSAKEGIGLRLD